MPKRKPEPRSTGPPPRRFGVRNFLDTLPWCDACGTWVRKHGHWDANGDCVSVKFHRSFDARVAALKGGTVGKGKHKGKAAVQAPVKAPPPPPPAAPVKRRRGTAATPAAPPLALWHVGVVLAEWGKADWVERLSKRLRDEARDEAMRLGHTLPRFSLDSATGAYTGAFEARCAGCMKLAIVNTVRYVATGQGWGGGVFKGECPNPGAAIPVTGETVGGQPATPAPRSAAVAGAAPMTRAPRAPRQRGAAAPLPADVPTHVYRGDAEPRPGTERAQIKAAVPAKGGIASAALLAALPKILSPSRIRKLLAARVLKAKP